MPSGDARRTRACARWRRLTRAEILPRWRVTAEVKIKRFHQDYGTLVLPYYSNRRNTISLNFLATFSFMTSPTSSSRTSDDDLASAAHGLILTMMKRRTGKQMFVEFPFSSTSLKTVLSSQNFILSANIILVWHVADLRSWRSLAHVEHHFHHCAYFIVS